MSSLVGFPNPLNEKAARVVAGVVALVAILALATGWYWLLAPLAYGFVARTISGPRFSPLGWTAMNVIGPRLGPKVSVPGPPKRFAQAIGAVCTTVGAVAEIAFGWHGLAAGILVLMILFATLESVFAFCAGCKMFAVLMRLGVIPPETCEACSDIWSRPGAAAGD